MKRSAFIMAAPYGLLLAAGMGVYANSFSGAFILDDETHIINNQAIQQLWPVAQGRPAPWSASHWPSTTPGATWTSGVTMSSISLFIFWQGACCLIFSDEHSFEFTACGLRRMPQD